MSAIACMFSSSVARGLLLRASPGPAARRRRGTPGSTARCSSRSEHAAACAPAMVLSSTSVKFTTSRTSMAAHVLERPAQHVQADERAEVADVPARVDGEPADVHADRVVAQRRERLLAPAQGVVQAKHRPGYKATVQRPRRARPRATVGVGDPRPRSAIARPRRGSVSRKCCTADAAVSARLASRPRVAHGRGHGICHHASRSAARRETSA